VFLFHSVVVLHHIMYGQLRRTCILSLVCVDWHGFQEYDSRRCLRNRRCCPSEIDTNAMPCEYRLPWSNKQEHLFHHTRTVKRVSTMEGSDDVEFSLYIFFNTKGEYLVDSMQNGTLRRSDWEDRD